MTGIKARNPSDVQDGQNVNPHTDNAPLPCPFCGGPARTFRYNGTTQAQCASNEQDYCAGIECFAPVALWNRRAPNAETNALLADIVEAHGNTDAAIDDYNAMKAERDALQAENVRLRAALLAFRGYGCPACGGDCASANPPVSLCIMKEADAALNKEGA
jgi:hypothetical protein